MTIPPDHSSIVDILAPARQKAAVIFSSPHSGMNYPWSFLAASQLSFCDLRKSEDSFVDLLFDSAPAYGFPLISALFPRAYVDPNRAPYDLDPAMFDAILPDWVDKASARALFGLGTVPRIVADGQAIYQQKLSFHEARKRIVSCYRPFHQSLRKVLAQTYNHFECYILIDCHSMPSHTADAWGVDMVLGNCHGKSSHPLVIETVERVLSSCGYKIARNNPYAGGFITDHYGNPKQAKHSLQIEISRSLYMNEKSYRIHDGFWTLKKDLCMMIQALGDLSLVKELRHP